MSTTPPPATGVYEIDRRRHVRAFERRLPAATAQLSRPLARRHAARDQSLRALLRTAKARSPWHARRLRHVDPDAASGDDLTAIPPMTKADLMANWDEIVTDRRLSLEGALAHLARVAEHGPAYLLDEYHVVASSGSNSTRGVFVWDFEGWLANGLAAARPMAWLRRHRGWTEGRRWASVVAADAAHMTAAARATFADRGPLEQAAGLSATLPIPEIVDRLNALRPDVVLIFPSILRCLVPEARAGRLRITPKAFVATSEPLTSETRLAVETAFGAFVLDHYGASEAGLIAHAFPGTPGLHLVEEHAVCEPVDERGRPVPPGTAATNLLVTNVVNRVLPLIRYELTDAVTFLDEPNPDPWTGRRIARVDGRLDDLFVYAEDIRVHPHVFESALERMQEIVEYQVRQTSRGASVAVRTAEGVNLEPVRERLVAALVRLGVPHPEVSISPVEHVQRLGGTAKLRRFVPLGG